MATNLNSNSPVSDPQRLVSTYSFSCLVTAFLNELDGDERTELRAAAAKFIAACAQDVPADEARQFFYNAYPGFHAFERFWLTLPAWQKYSNVGCDSPRSRWEAATYHCYTGKAK